MKKFSINTTIELTNSKIMGDLIIIGGLYGFCSGIDATQSVLLVGIGAAAIGIKQYFTNKSVKSNGSTTE